MSSNEQCQCPPKPYFSTGSLASGSNAELQAHQRWEAEHGGHPAATFQRLEPVRIDPMQLGFYREELRQHLADRGPYALLSVAPHHLHALLEAASQAGVPSPTAQASLDKALAALRNVRVEGDNPGAVGRAVLTARDLLREAGARNIPVPPDEEVTQPNATPLPWEKPETTMAEQMNADLALEPGYSNLRG